MNHICVISDMSLDLIEEAFSTNDDADQELLFLPFARPSALNSRSQKHTRSTTDFVFTFFLPSMWHLFSQTLTNISSPNDAKNIDEIIHSYIRELQDVLSLSDTNFIVLPRAPDGVLFGMSLGGAEYKSFLSWKRVWLNFSQKLSCAFENNSNVVLVDALDLFSPSEIQNSKARQRIFFELMVEHTWQEAQSFAKNVVSSVQFNTVASGAKCICLDLDNTLWGGILGDVGVSGITLGGLTARGRAFVEIQKFFKALKNRGYFLAIVSKNYIDVVMGALDRHPDMVLTREDFQVIYCGWSPKSYRIKTIAEALNIGEDSVVFFDDSPFERNEVKKNAPQVIVPHYSSNPMKCLSSLYSSKLFHTPLISDDDFSRNLGTTINNINIEGADFLVTQKSVQSGEEASNTELSIEFEKVSSRSFSRVLQLINKTNQFNLTGNRYTETSLISLLDECQISLVGNVKDEFANYGLTVIILAKVETATVSVQEFVMSCRVFGRGVEVGAIEEVVSRSSMDKKTIEKVKFAARKTDKNRAILEFIDSIIGKSGHCLKHLGVKFGLEDVI